MKRDTHEPLPPFFFSNNPPSLLLFLSFFLKSIHLNLVKSLMKLYTFDTTLFRSRSKKKLTPTTITQTYISFPPYYSLIYLLSFDTFPLFIPFYILQIFIYFLYC